MCGQSNSQGGCDGVYKLVNDSNAKPLKIAPDTSWADLPIQPAWLR